jgi:hypothetical protein
MLLLRSQTADLVRQGREHLGVLKNGALLAGVLRCRRCGRKLTIRYTGGRHDIPRYSCNRGWLDDREPRCTVFGGLTVDDEVIADMQPPAGEIVLLLHWVGGIHTELRLDNPRARRWRSSKRCACWCASSVMTLIAGLLNRNGLTTGYGNRWTRERVTSLRSDHRIPVYFQQVRESEGRMTLTQAAATLAVSATTLRLAAERGEVKTPRVEIEMRILAKEVVRYFICKTLKHQNTRRVYGARMPPTNVPSVDSGCTVAAKT